METEGLTSAIQELLVCMICFDTEKNGGMYVSKIVPVNSFGPYYKDIVRSAKAFMDKYGEVPGEHTADLIEELQEREPAKASAYEEIYDSMLDSNENLNKKFVLEKAEVFVQAQRIQKGISDAIDTLEANQPSSVAEARSILQKSLEFSAEVDDFGVFIHDEKRSLNFLDEDNKNFLCGIPELDRYGYGPGRGQFHLFVAPSGRGKSWWLQHLAKAMMMQHKKILYITLEMGETSVCQRLMQMLFSIQKRREDEIMHSQVVKDKLNRFSSIEPKTIEERPAFDDDNIEEHLRSKIMGLKNRSPILVKQFPTGSLTVEHLEAYLDNLEASVGFIPDVILIDYIDIMKLEGNVERFAIKKQYEGIRGIAVKRNVAICTATQTNKAGVDAKLVTEKDSTESYTKIAISDSVITYSQTPEENKMGLARLYTDKGRGDVSKFQVVISQAYGVGQFMLTSAFMDDEVYWNQVKSNADSEYDYDEDENDDDEWGI